jgi:hypothetical protein
LIAFTYCKLIAFDLVLPTAANLITFNQRSPNSMKTTFLSSLLAAVVTVLSPSVHAATVEYYIGLDTQVTIPTGTYAGLPNPNYNRPTFLYAHIFPATPSSNHYHPIGRYQYIGPAETPTITNIGSNYQIPESYTLLPPLELKPQIGGVFDGKLTLQADPGIHYTDLNWNVPASLSSFAATSTEGYLYNSSAGRYNGDLSGTVLKLELVSLTPGLNIGHGSTLNILPTVGSQFTMGTGSSGFGFNPILWTDSTALPGTYSAEFKIIDNAGSLGESGVFKFNTQVIPEPSALLTSLLGLGFLFVRKRSSATRQAS